MEHVDHMPIDKMIEDIGEGACQDQHKGKFILGLLIKENEINSHADNHRNAQAEENFFILVERSPRCTAIAHMIDREIDSQPIVEDCDASVGKSWEKRAHYRDIVMREGLQPTICGKDGTRNEAKYPISHNNPFSNFSCAFTVIVA